MRIGRETNGTYAIQTIEKDAGGVTALLQRAREELARFVDFASVVCDDAVVKTFVGLALSLGKRAASPLDVGARTIMMTVEKNNARPDADRALVLSAEIVIESGEEELLDSRLSVRFIMWLGRADRVGRHRIRHQMGIDPELIIGQKQDSGNINQESGIRNQASACGVIQASMPVIECVPNVSEGRRMEVVNALVDAVRRTPSVRLLDHSSDTAHNRSVLTMAGDATSLRAAVVALFEAALPRIDLRQHAGEHPRLGAVDVVPFVPIADVTMDECVRLAKETAAEVADRFQVPVYLYEEASGNPARKNLEDIRRGEYEGLEAKMSTPGWAPDFGPARPHPTAGATVMGARMPLIAYNINLATNRLDVAKKIAAAIRFSSGGFRYVKAMGIALEDRGIVQVSINLTNYEKTPMFRVFEAVKQEAARYGVSILESEIVGLVPAAALIGTAEHALQLASFTPNQILENKLRGTS